MQVQAQAQAQEQVWGMAVTALARVLERAAVKALGLARAPVLVPEQVQALAAVGRSSSLALVVGCLGGQVLAQAAVAVSARRWAPVLAQVLVLAPAQVLELAPAQVLELAPAQTRALAQALALALIWELVPAQAAVLGARATAQGWALQLVQERVRAPGLVAQARAFLHPHWPLVLAVRWARHRRRRKRPPQVALQRTTSCAPTCAGGSGQSVLWSCRANV